eukprot:m.479982 g.479982  ORF g.479982 m.479982 type:complete len:224 (+) comp21658_c0_seq1:42-713(+)
MAAALEAQEAEELEQMRRELPHLQAFVQTVQSTQGTLTLGSLINEIAVDLLDAQILDAVFEFHRNTKLGLVCLCLPPPLGKEHIHKGIVSVPGYDVFGQRPSKVGVQPFPCPNCGTARQPAKFAPHLEKCMGMGGRESRRAASRSRSAAQDDSLDGATDPSAARRKPQGSKRQTEDNGGVGATKKRGRKAKPAAAIVAVPAAGQLVLPGGELPPLALDTTAVL